MLPNETAAQLLDGLQLAGLVHMTKRDNYALARPPEKITAHDLLTAARALCQVPPEMAKELPTVPSISASPAMKELEELESTWAKSRTLADLANQR
jgi:DNA-binding IscR family transcriptional regulator